MKWLIVKGLYVGNIELVYMLQGTLLIVERYVQLIDATGVC